MGYRKPYNNIKATALGIGYPLPLSRTCSVNNVHTSPANLNVQNSLNLPTSRFATPAWPTCTPIVGAGWRLAEDQDTWRHLGECLCNPWSEILLVYLIFTCGLLLTPGSGILSSIWEAESVSGALWQTRYNTQCNLFIWYFDIHFIWQTWWMLFIIFGCRNIV